MMKKTIPGTGGNRYVPFEAREGEKSKDIAPEWEPDIYNTFCGRNKKRMR